MMKQYEIQEWTMMQGWTNCWTDENQKPVMFSTISQAEQELALHISDLKLAWECGEIEDEPDRADYRIVEVTG